MGGKRQWGRRLKDHGLWEQVQKTVTPLENRDGAQKTFARLIDESGCYPAAVGGGAPASPLDGLRNKTERQNSPQKIPHASLEKLKSRGFNRSHLQSSALDYQTRQKPADSGRLEKPVSRNIRKGKIPIDAVIDLHGMTQFQAHNRLYDFLASSRQQGHRVVLVITGKGSSGEGVLRRAVPLWLEEASFRSIVGGFGVAHRSHGGEGALYVRLKRNHAR